MVEKLRKMGIRGYDAPQKGKALDLPLPEEGSKERDQVEKAISLYIPPPNMGRWAGYLTPDEENFLVDIVEMRDFYGFGMDRGELQLMAQRWCKRGGFKGVLCGKNWFRGFMKRAKQYKPDFGEAKRSKIDSMRTEKQSPEVISAFFDRVDAIYAHHAKLGDFGPGKLVPDPSTVFNTDEVHANPERKWTKKLGNNERLRKFAITTGDKFPFHITIVITTCADGTAKVLPMIIHTGARMNKNIVENLPDEYPLHVTRKGSQDKLGFEKWCRHFVKSARDGMPTDIKTVLYLDGHNSRWTYDGLTHLHDNNVLVICLPSHTSIITQPNDNGINSKFHDEMGIATKTWRNMHAGLNIAKGDANWIIAQAWDKTRLHSDTIKKGFGSQTTGVCPLDRNAVNYRDLKISLAITPASKAAQDTKVSKHAVRARAYKDYVWMKARHGSSVVALREAILEESQRHWLKAAQDIAQVKDERKKHSYKGVPNTKTGACCTAKDFREAIASYEKERQEKENMKAKRKDERERKKMEKQVAVAVAKQAAGGKPPSATKKKAKKRKAPDPETESDNEDGIELEHDMLEGEVQERPPVESRVEVDVQGGIFYCEVTAHDDDGSVHLRTQDGEMMNIFMEDWPWKYAYKCHECDEWGTQKLLCEHCDVTRPAGVIEEVSAPLYAV